MAVIRVLFVDDDPDFLDLASRLLTLETDDVAVETETSPRAALDRLDDVDCVVSDYKMVELDGLELLERVREYDPDLPFILFTGKGTEDVAGRAVSAGVTDYVPKTGSPEQYAALAKRIRDAVEGRRTRERMRRHRRLNEFVREVALSLSDAASRESLEERVCDRLSSLDEVSTVWIVQRDADRGLVPRQWAGETAVIEALADEDWTETPEAAALADVEPVVENDLETSGLEAWSSVLADAGFGSAAAAPIAHGGVVEGAIGVYGRGPDAFDDLFAEILAEVGEFLGYGISSLRRREALFADSYLELEFRVYDPEITVLGLSEACDCEVAVEDAFSRTDGGYVQFISVRETDPTEFDHALDETPGIARARRVDAPDGDGNGQWAVVSERPCVAARLADHGVRTRRVTADRGEGHVVAEVPDDVDTRSVVEAVRRQFRDAELLCKRQRTRALDADGVDSRVTVLEHLTARQREVAAAAYRSGFFEWPREASAEEVADLLDISQPAFSQHLRAIQGTVFASLFERRRDAFRVAD